MNNSSFLVNNKKKPKGAIFMKKFIIFMISVISIFLISFYIGVVINSFRNKSYIDNKEIAETKNIGTEDFSENDGLEQTVSDEETAKEHYVLRDKNGYVEVYTVDNEGKEELYLTTEIATEYLPETDKIALKAGIHLYSKEGLNEILQDFE